MSLRTPLGKVRGLGSAKSGTEHWWMQRVTAIANIPLTIGFIIVLVSLIGADHAAVAARLGHPVIVILQLAFIVSITWHMRLGMQVVIEDYVHHEGWKIACVVANTFFSAAIAIAGIFAILKLGFGA
ncbi:MAG: succinate dehydrogenase, hydrophobic membrane anchor protein [Rhizobiales bacterium]|nr:succinate dehydrogenase, hydrophobic membrane anchor protein [Hyphomicrobiales bacterium]